MKQITVFGANGKIGSRVVKILLSKNYKVVAFVHNNSSFDPNPNLTVIGGDIHDSVKVHEALQGSDTVISALGSWGTRTKDILSVGIKNIVPAMHANKITRIISLTGSDARDPDDRPGIIHKITHELFGATAIKIMKDGENHMRILRDSGLDWTVLRSPVMLDSGEKGNYKLTMDLPGIFATIHRDDVADAMVKLAETGEYSHKSPIIYRK